jgi:RNA polymerase sigma factor (sigma-70 family)
MTDTELLRLFAEVGRESAFEELVRRHAHLVYSAALRQVRGDRYLAEDVSQAVFADAARKARALVRHTSFVGWLYTSARFTAAKALRAERRRRMRERRADAVLAAADPPDDDLWSALKPILDEALSELAARDREVLLLRFFENLPLAKVGVHAGVSENAARMRVDRALGRLRKLVARRGVALTAAVLGATLSERGVAAAPAGLADKVARDSVSTAAAGVSSVLAGVKTAALSAGALLAIASVAAVLFAPADGRWPLWRPEKRQGRPPAAPTTAEMGVTGRHGGAPRTMRPSAGLLQGRIVD